MSSVDIRQHAARKRTASEAGSSRPLKKGRAFASTPTEEPDVQPTSISESILALSAPTALPNMPSVEGVASEDGATRHHQ